VSCNVSFPPYYLMKELDQFDLKIKKIKNINIWNRDLRI